MLYLEELNAGKKLKRVGEGAADLPVVPWGAWGGRYLPSATGHANTVCPPVIDAGAGPADRQGTECGVEIRQPVCLGNVERC